MQEVVDEIKNNRQLMALAVLPYNLELKQPDPESLKAVTDFAKKTGDFAALSLTDLTVLALTYELEKRFVGVDHLKKEPTVAKTVYTVNKPAANPNIAGFYNPEGKSSESTGDDNMQENENVIDEGETNSDDELQDSESSTDGSENEETINDEELIKKFGSLGFNTVANSEADDVLQPVKNENEEEIDEGQGESFEDEASNNSNEEDDDEGWITPSNISNVKKNFGGDVLEEKDVEVACITTDFAMQNVLKQMGLNVTSLDGRIIKHVRTFILRCHTCYKTVPDVTKIFCPKCGHKTLKRVSVSVNEKGEQVIHLNPKKEITSKFKNQPRPLPKGGKHAVNPLVFQDQIIPQQRVTKKSLQKTNALEDTYTAGISPFVVRDVDSRASKLRTNTNIKQWMQNYEYDNYRRGYKRNNK